MTISPKGETVNTPNVQPADLLHMCFALYNSNSTHGFTIILTGVCDNTIMIWIFPTASKQPPVRIIHFILTNIE